MVKYCLSCVYTTGEKKISAENKAICLVGTCSTFVFSILVSTFVSKLLCLREDFQTKTFWLSGSESGPHPVLSLILSLQIKQLQRWKDILAPSEWLENTSLGKKSLEKNSIGKITELEEALDKSLPVGRREGWGLAARPLTLLGEKETQRGEITCLRSIKL